MRERFEAVEIPLNRTNQSQNARNKPFFAGSAIFATSAMISPNKLDSEIDLPDSGFSIGSRFGSRLSGGCRLLDGAGDAETHQQEAEAFAH